jgi:hypothetical protein
MMRHSTPVLLMAASLFVLSCAHTTVVQPRTVEVRVDETVDFAEFETFSIVASNIVPPEDRANLGEEQVAFSDMVNELIIEAMQTEPVCLTFIPPGDVTDENKPDLWAADGLGRSANDGNHYECVAGWWWGYWGWYWDPCGSWYRNYVEYDVGTLLIPVGPPPLAGEEATPIFAGLAPSVVGTGPDLETKARAAVQQIFAEWPIQRTCPSK